ncbi:MAG: hypothetical protein U0821_18700 [Chloroflexota bacterium]
MSGERPIVCRNILPDHGRITFGWEWTIFRSLCVGRRDGKNRLSWEMESLDHCIPTDLIGSHGGRVLVDCPALVGAD